MDKKHFDWQEFNLNNGLKVITIKKPTQLMSINLCVNIGSFYETEKQKGMSHFIEHMLFKGTISRTNEKLNNELENLGGEYNAYTDYNSTVFTINALESEMSKAMELLADMFMNSNFLHEEMEKEKSVIISEINSSKDDVEDFGYQKILEVAFSKSDLRYDTLGIEENIINFDRDTVLDFYKEYYRPNNSVIIITSEHEHGEVKKLVEMNFMDWEKGDFKKKDIILEKNSNKLEIIRKGEIEQSTIIYLYTFYDLTEEEELALRILCYKLGESQNSILFRKLREEKGLAYDVYSDIDTGKNTKLLFLYTSINKENLDETSLIIEQCIDDIINGTIEFTFEDIELMKKVFKTSTIAALEDTSELGSYVLSQVIEGKKADHFLEYLEELKKVKLDIIRNVARKVFSNPTKLIIISEED
ncbi:M16 family metallopeptidase [Clostridium sp. DL1XJH146]